MLFQFGKSIKKKKAECPRNQINLIEKFQLKKNKY